MSTLARSGTACPAALCVVDTTLPVPMFMAAANHDRWTFLGGVGVSPANDAGYPPRRAGRCRRLAAASSAPAPQGGVGVPPAGLGTRYQYAGGWGYESGPWGQDPNDAASPGPLVLYGGNPDLPPILLLHVGERWYQPGIGRFVQRDPFGIDGGLNTYGYMDGEPLAGVDPSGLANWGTLEMGAVYRGWRGTGKSVDESVKWTERWSIETGLIETMCVCFAGGSGRSFSGFTRHGVKQLVARGLTKSVIENAIKHGVRTVQADGTIRYVYENVVVITNAAGQVITVWKTGH